jgi:hypothetical protein
VVVAVVMTVTSLEEGRRSEVEEIGMEGGRCRVRGGGIEGGKKRVEGGGVGLEF